MKKNCQYYWGWHFFPFLVESEDTDIMWWLEIIVPFVCFVVLVEIIFVSWAGMSYSGLLRPPP